MPIDFEIGRVADDPQRLLRSRQRHVESPEIRQETETLQVLRSLHLRANTGEDDDIGLSALKRIHGADLDVFDLGIEAVLPNDPVNDFADLPHLRDVRRDDADGVVRLRRRKRREKLCDDGTDDRRLLPIEEAAALLLADALRFIQDSQTHLHVHKGVRGYGALREHGAEARETDALAVDEHAAVDVVVRPRADGGTHAVLHVERELRKAVSLQPLEERDSVAHAVDGGVLNRGGELVTVSHEDHERRLHAERDEALRLRALRGLVHDHDGNLRALVEKGGHLGVSGSNERGNDDARLH